jgi:hypothetical protein
MDQDIRFCTTSDGVRLAYAVTGEGPPLVMSATWLTHLERQWSSLAWRPWLDAFTRSHEREIPGAGKLSKQELQAISQKPCGVLQNMGP